MTGIKVTTDDEGRYCGITIRCHAGHKHFITTTWTPPGMVRSPYYSADPAKAWTFNGDFNSPSILPSVKTESGHYMKSGDKPGNCYCDFSKRFPDEEPMPKEWYCYRCHFVLTGGVMNYCPDCTHEFVGKSLPLNKSSEIPVMQHPNQGFKERTPVRFIQKIRTDSYWRIYWWDRTHPCTGGSGMHSAMNYLDVGPLYDRHFADHREKILADWPTKCDKCGLDRPCSYEDRHKGSYDNGGGCAFQIYYQDVYNTASGQPEPGDIFYDNLCQRLKDHDDEPGHCHQTHKSWTNCDGVHLHVILPNGSEWDIDSRCNNCLSPDDTTHRCWIRHGRPELGEPVTVDKNGRTCAAGGGSIDSKRGTGPWHGFLRHGELVR